jgi:hypothetical protein
MKRRCYLPGGAGEALAMFSGRMSTAILRYPTGRYGLVGSIPFELSEENPRALSPGSRRSLVWDTEQQAIEALLAIGVTRFQRADCSWYEPEQPAIPGAESVRETEQPTPTFDAPFSLNAPVARTRGKQESLF